MTSNQSSFEIGIEFDSVLKAISKQIYETPYAFIRENVQNAVDAVRIQALRDERNADNEEYQINVKVVDRIVSVFDNGIGMSRTHLQDYFWTIGSSGKRSKEAREAGCLGMFGIGGFANFGVCNSLRVTSQDSNSSVGTETFLSIDDIREAGAKIPLVAVSDSPEGFSRGTVVVGEMIDPPDVDDLKTYLESFVQFVPISINFNGEKISQKQIFKDVDQKKLIPIDDGEHRWNKGDMVLKSCFFEDRGHTLVAFITGSHRSDSRLKMKGHFRFANGTIEVFKRGFKLCSTQVPSTIGISGRLEGDLFVPTAGRDSLDAETESLLGQLGTILEEQAIDIVLKSSDRIAQHTRIFRYMCSRGLFHKMGNVSVRLADGNEKRLADIKKSANKGQVSIFYGFTQKHALNQVMQAQGHIVVQLSSDRYRQKAEKNYLERYCQAKPFEGIVDCAKLYDPLSRFELIFLSEIEQNIARSYEIKNFNLIPGCLTEDIPAFIKEKSNAQPIEIYIDVRHSEVAKLEKLGLRPLTYSLISKFCQEYLGPSLKKWSPRFFGDGALNLEFFAKRRSELWVLVKDDIGIIRRSGQRQLFTRRDVAVVNVTDKQPLVGTEIDKKKRRLLQIVDDDDATGLGGYYIRLLDRAYDAYGDLITGCDSNGLVWAGNKLTFVASDGVSAQFQYEIRLDEIVATKVDGILRAEGAIELDRSPQELFDGLYFFIPCPLEKYLVPMGEDEEIRLNLDTEWIDMRTGRLWEVDEQKILN